MADNVNVNYEDERFTKVEDAKQEALTNLEQTYGGMINESDKHFQSQIDASKQFADKQSQLQQEQTDFAIEQVEQQKEQAKKDYIKEQSGAYVDWQKQSAKHGVEAEKMASAGLTGTGYSESSQVGMYNTYQNRVAVAREAYNRAVLNYDNAIKDARLQNSAKLAEIAFNALQQQLELSLQGFQYKNSLILEQASKKTELDQIHYQRYQDVLQQINTENAMAEEIRRYNEQMALEKESTAYNRLVDLITGVGYTPTAEELKAAGMSSAEAKAYAKYYTPSTSGSYRGGGYTYDANVAAAQQWLKTQGYYTGNVDGLDGPLTKAALKKSPYSSIDALLADISVKPNDTGGDYPIDWASLRALGYGNITPDKLDELIRKGELKETVQNGKLTYSAPRTASGSAKQNTAVRM